MDRLMSMRVFQKVIDEGGFAAAARALNMSAAGVTRQIADLEAYLGTRLLHRSTRKVALSPAGEAYLERVRTILVDIDEAHLFASSHTHELAGEVRVLAQPALASHVLAPLVAGFGSLYPKIHLHVDVESFQEPLVEDYDVTLLPTQGYFNGDVIARKISSTYSILVASPDYLERKGAPQTPQELSQHDVLRLRSGSAVPGRWTLLKVDEHDAPMDVEVAPKLWINHADTLVTAAVGGAGITALAASLLMPYLERGELVQVLPSWIAGRLSLYAALPSRKFMPERTRVFLDYLTQQAHSHSPVA